MANSKSLQITLAFAYRHYEAASESEREAILEAFVENMPNPEAETAAVILHHRHEARAHQLHLDGLINRHPPST